MSLKQILSHFNLDQKEASLYLASLELGIASARDIAKKAGIQRTYFYDLSDRLIKLGLLQQVKRTNKRLFIATDPDQLLELQKERLEELHQALPQLKAIYNTAGNKPKVFYYEGRDGIDQINYDSLRFKGELVGFTTPRFMTADEQKLHRDFINRRVSLGKKARIIGQLSPEVQDLKKRDKDELRETRMLPEQIFSSNVEIGIYSNRVFVANYKEEFGFIIEDSDFAKTMKYIFEIVWNSGKVID